MVREALVVEEEWVRNEVGGQRDALIVNVEDAVL